MARARTCRRKTLVNLEIAFLVTYVDSLRRVNVYPIAMCLCAMYAEHVKGNFSVLYLWIYHTHSTLNTITLTNTAVPLDASEQNELDKPKVIESLTQNKNHTRQGGTIFQVIVQWNTKQKWCRNCAWWLQSSSFTYVLHWINWIFGHFFGKQN